MDAEYLKTFLRNHNIKPNFTYGQNFLIDEIVLEDIVDTAKVSAEDKVLEIGPGIGNLTRKLLERGAFVLSVEKDPKFLPILKSLKKDFPDTFRYEIADALEFDFIKILNEGVVSRQQTADSIQHTVDSKQQTEISYKVVANIPYYITGKILQMFLTTKFKPTSITVLTQKEVAKNVIAKPGQLSILGISVQLYGVPSLAQIVPAKSFYPAPKVDSAVLHIELFSKPKYELEDEKKFFHLLKACFAGKRKQIHNTLTANLRIEKGRVEEVLQELKIEKTTRPQQLTIEQWIELTKKIE
jgi:16S rRNA (adenine1518-N6/adenine1519-N6)-dimethyltransferase